MGIMAGSASPNTLHRHTANSDLYAVVTKPGVTFRNLNSVSSPVSYILDTGPASQAGTHV